MNKKYMGFLLALLLLVCSYGGGIVSAAAENTASDIIWCGLWDGSNLTFGSLGCSNQQSSSSTSDTSSEQTNSDQTDQNSTTQTTATNGTYASLGDSVAAGYGLPSGSASSATDTACGRSDQAYPYLVAQARNLSLTHIACSGATAGDLVTDQRVSSQEVPAQLDQAFAQGTPQLISITAGANDAHWSTFIRTCFTADCSTAASTAAAHTLLLTMQAKLTYDLASIKVRSNGTPPQTIITGYYDPVGSDCASGQTYVTPQEIQWLSDETASLNQAIQHVASHYSFVTFVPVDFSGHDICSGDSWVQGLADPGPFHPTAAGQQAIARDVLNALHS